MLVFTCPFNRVCIVPNMTFVSSCSSVHLLYVSVRLLPKGFPWNLNLGTSMKICQETLNLFKIGWKYRAIYMRTKKVLVLPATLNKHKSSAFGWNSIMLLGYARRFKHYANPPRCYVMPTLNILFMPVYITTLQNCVLLHAAIVMFKCTEFAGPLNILYVSLYSALCSTSLSVNTISWHCHCTLPSVAPAVWRLVNSELVGMWKEAVVT
jgi:hypothetical protein